MKNVSVCHCCGSKTVEYKHSLGKGLVKVLDMMARVSIRWPGPVKTSRLKLTRNEAGNLQKLRYWGFIEKTNIEGDRKKGTWTVLPLGVDFIQGKTPAPKSVWTYRGDFKRFEGDLIEVEDVVAGYKFRMDYADERRPKPGAFVAEQLTLA